MKQSLELDIAECQMRFEEVRRNEEEKLRSHYESELALLEQKYCQLKETLQAQEAQLKEKEDKYLSSCSQYEEQLKRLNDKYSVF